MKIVHKFNPQSIYALSPWMIGELTYKLCEVEREDADEQAAAVAAMEKISAKNWDLSEIEFNELLQTLRDIESSAEHHKDKLVLKEIRRLFIGWGIYVVVTDEDLRNTIVSGHNKKKYCFQLGGQKYDFDSWNFPGRPSISTAAA